MQHTTLEQLANRRSIRDFTGESIPAKDLELILRAAQRAPTSVNGQQISLIYTRDKGKLEKIAELCGGQKHIAMADAFVAIVIDFYRTDCAVKLGNGQQVIERSAEGIMVGAIDAGIMLSSLQTAAESLGYGTTAIGAVRENPLAFIELFNLPKKSFVAVGTTLGVPSDQSKKSPLKPRVPFASFAMEESYDSKAVKEGVAAYEAEMQAFRKNQGANLPSYVELLGSLYTKIYYRQTKAGLETQGFRFADSHEES